MKPASNRLPIAVLCALAAATVALIAAHSLQASSGSWAESNSVAALLEPALRGLYDLAGGFLARAGAFADLTYEEFVRKCAHFAEYAVLGAECAAITVLLARRVVSPYLWACLFAVLAIAVADEYAQAFVGRTSLVVDVVIDFSGALAGIGIALAVAALVLRRRAGANRA